MKIPPLLNATSPELAALEAKLGQEGVKPERPSRQEKLLVKDGRIITFRRILPIDDCVNWVWSMIAKVKSGCWEWQGQKDFEGYGVVKAGTTVNGKQYRLRVHRVVARFILGRDLDSMVCHHCDNKMCANPSHLFIGTAADNNRERVVPAEVAGVAPRRGHNFVRSLRETHGACRCIWNLVASGTTGGVMPASRLHSTGPLSGAQASGTRGGSLCPGAGKQELSTGGANYFATWSAGFESRRIHFSVGARGEVPILESPGQCCELIRESTRSRFPGLTGECWKRHPDRALTIDERVGGL